MSVAEDKKSGLLYTELGVASVVCGVVGLVGFLSMLVFGVLSLYVVVLILGVFGVVLGALAYWWMTRDTLGLVGFGLGMLLIILWFLYTMYISVRGMVHGVI